MNRIFLFFALACSSVCAADHFDYYEFLLLETNLCIISEKVDKYQSVMDSEDYDTIKYYLKSSQLIVNGKTEYFSDQAK